MFPAAHDWVRNRHAALHCKAWRGTFLLGIVGLASIARDASAQTAVSWTSTSNGLWSAGGNWSTGTPPASSLTTNYALFNNQPGVIVDIDTGQNVAGIEFGANGGAYTLTHTGANKTITIGGYGIRNYSSNDQVITGANLRLTINAPTTFRNDGAGTLTISAAENTINTSGTNSLSLGGTGVSTISTAIAGTGHVYKIDTGTWTVSNAANDYADTVIGTAGGGNAGTLALGASGSLGSGALIVYAGTLNTGSGFFTEAPTAVTLGGGASGASASITGNGTLILGGNITYDATNNPNGAIISANLDQNGNDRTFTVGDSSAATADLTVTGVISGTKKLYKEGAGTLVLSGNNTYADGTYVNGGTLAVYTLADGGMPSSIGQSALGTAEFTLNSGTLQYLGSGSNTNRLFTVTTAGGTLDASGTGAVNFTNVAALKMGGSGTRTLTLSGTNTADNTLSPTIGNGGGATNITKTGAGTWVLAASASSYSGVTTIAAGTLTVATMANGGANSSLGAATSAASNLVLAGGTLRYTGGAGSTDRLFTIGSGGGAIDASGTGAFTFSNSGSLAATGVGNRTLTLTGTNAGANTIASGVVDSSASDKTALVKSGTGTWTLTGNNAHTGGTTLNSGTLNLNSATAFGGPSSVFTINAGTFNNTSGGAITVANNNAQNWNGNFTFTGTNNLNLGTGAVTLNASPTITIGGGTLTVGGAISGAGLGFVKTGAGTLALTGTNSSYTGATTINAGTLSVAMIANGGSNSSIGAASTAASNLVFSGGTLQYTGSGSSSDRLFSVATNGGTIDASGTGLLAFSNSGSMGFNGQSGARTLTLTGPNNGSVAAAIGDNGGATTITKSGNGTWTLTGSNSNTYSGVTTVNSGTLALAKSGGAVAIAGNVSIGDGSGTDVVRLDAANQIASTSAVAFANAGTPTLNVNGFSQTVGSLTASNSSAQVQLGAPATSSTFTVGDSSNTTFAGVISGANAAGLTKSGSGALTLSGSNTYFGTTTVTQGTLLASGASALGDNSGAVAVTNGGTLTLAGGTTITKSATLLLNGSGAAGAAGALTASGGGTSSKWIGDVNLSGNATIGALSNLLTIGEGTTYTNVLAMGANALTLNATAGPLVTPVFEPLPAYALDATNIVVQSKLTGTGSLIKTGVGTATLMAFSGGGNTFSGDTIVLAGKLILDGTNNSPAINSTNVYVGNSVGPGAADTVILQVGQLGNATGPQNVIGTRNGATNGSSASLTIYSDGVLKMNNANTGLANLTLEGGHVDEGNISSNPVLTLSGNVTTNTSSRTALINNGKLALSADNFTFTVASGSTATGIDLQVDSAVQSGIGYTGASSGTGLVKAGSGKMVLSNLNTYAGITSVSGGVLNIQHNSALGQTGAFHGDTSNGTAVQGGAQLQLQGGITVGALESLTLSGSGISSDGALRNVSGTNTYNGMVYVAADTRINSDVGSTLTLANTNGVNSTIVNGTSAGRNLTFGGAGNTIVNGGVAALIGNVGKEGSGTLTLAGANTYTGSTDIATGTVLVTHSNALSGSGALVRNGASLQLAQDAGGGSISLGAVGSTINGTGFNGGGALQNVSGNNSYAGAITLGSNALISANNGTSLALNGGIGTAAHGLIVGTAANNGNLTVNGNVSGGGSLTKAGTGSLTFAGSDTAFGAVTVNAGSLTFSGTTTTTGAVHLSGGSLAIGNGTTANTGAVDAVAGTTLTIATGGHVVANFDSGATTFSGSIAGQGEFEKTGAGTLVFNNTFTAPDLTLTLSGGTLSLTGGQFTFGTIHITGNTILDFNNSAGTLLSSANLIIDAGVTVTVNNWISVANNSAQSAIWQTTSTLNGGTLGGTHQLGGTPLSQVTFSYSGLTATWVSGNTNGWFDHEIRPTPEPATYGLMLVAGCSGLLGFRRIRRNRR